jgi:CO/xanthine dehydrogenase FAD-binding subunit
MGNVGGNIAQLHRRWHIRKPENRFNCIRKGGTTCFAMTGDNRYHSIFGNVNRCIAVHPSDIAPALIGLNARIATNARSIRAEDFRDVGVAGKLINEASAEAAGAAAAEDAKPLAATRCKVQIARTLVKRALPATVWFPESSSLSPRLEDSETQRAFRSRGRQVSGLGPPEIHRWSR